MEEQTSDVGKRFHNAFYERSRKEKELEEAEKAVKAEMQLLSDVIEKLNKKHGIRIETIYPHYVYAMGDKAQTLAYLDVEMVPESYFQI